MCKFEVDSGDIPVTTETLVATVPTPTSYVEAIGHSDKDLQMKY